MWHPFLCNYLLATVGSCENIFVRRLLYEIKVIIMKSKLYVQTKKADFYGIGEKYNIDPVVARIIRNRDVIGDEQINMYLNGTIENMYDPLLMKDMDKATDITINKINEGKKIRVIGDYDIDGINSIYILTEGLREVGADVSGEIPDRIKDGYGINERLIDEAYADGIDTIITCDNGIAAIEQIKHAKELGMTVIVTDHHDIPFVESEGERKYIYSEADAIVDPKRDDCTYPYPLLCGAGIAMKFIQVIFSKKGFNKNAWQKYLEYAAIATVGDIVDLQDENRIIVKEGLKRLHVSKNYGLNALIEINKLEKVNINSYHIGFVLGPCLNASGRLDTAMQALAMLRAKDPENAAILAANLKELNDTRKDMTQEQCEKAYELIDNSELNEDTVLVVYIPGCHESLCGIIAGRIRERYYKPTIVLTDAEEGLKGSARSIEEYNMFEGLNKVRELMTKFGGHPMAAGLSLPKENLDILRKKLNEQAELTEEQLTEKIWIDVPMPIDYVNEEIIKELELLEPFGKANEKPVFADRNIGIRSASVIGKNKNVLKLKLISQNGKIVDGICFNGVEEFEQTVIEKFGENGKNELDAAYKGMNNRIQLNIIYYPSINEYNGNVTVQMVIKKFAK